MPNLWLAAHGLIYWICLILILNYLHCQIQICMSGETGASIMGVQEPLISKRMSTMKFKSNYVIVCVQLKEKIIPSFKAAHGAGYQALFLINNSPGYSAYGEDALLISCMTIKPGGKQACMHNGWYIHDSVRILQPMIYPSNHLDHPDTPQGVKIVHIECGMWQQKLQGKCEKACKADTDACCNKCNLEWQPNFWEQKSLVQETIEAAGHLCLFLPKFHCELNFIEFFGVWSRSIFMITVIILLIPLKKICRKHFVLCTFIQSEDESTGCFSRLKLTGQDSGHTKLKLRSENSVPQSINHRQFPNSI